MQKQAKSTQVRLPRNSRSPICWITFFLRKTAHNLRHHAIWAASQREIPSLVSGLVQVRNLFHDAG